MSGARAEAVTETEDQVDAGGEQGGSDDRSALEARARNLGWKPQEEFRSGPPSNWLDADEFVRRGEEELPLVRARNRRLEEMVGGLQKRVDEAVTVVSDLTDRFRTADQRAYERAMKDLAVKRQEAVANADTEAFQRAETEIQDLQKTAPKTETKAAPAAATPPAEVVEWAAANPWFQSDPDLNAEAQAIHQALLARRPTLTLKENLAEVAKKIRMANPEKFENPRRTAPSAVSGASSETPRRSNNKEPGFDEIPRADQAGYNRAVKMLNGKGKPFTKEEFATLYWNSK